MFNRHTIIGKPHSSYNASKQTKQCIVLLVIYSRFYMLTLTLTLTMTIKNDSFLLVTLHLFSINIVQNSIADHHHLYRLLPYRTPAMIRNTTVGMPKVHRIEETLMY